MARHASVGALAGASRCAGFTLIEIMVATVLLGSVLIGLMSAATLGAREIRNSKLNSVAIIKAREAIDDIAAKGFDNVPTGLVTKDADAGRFALQVATLVTLRPGLGDIKDVRVSVIDAKGKELQRFTMVLLDEF